MNIKKTGLLFLAIIMIAVPILAADSNVEEEKANVAAVVNGEEITVDELDSYMQLNNLVMQLYQTNQEFAQFLIMTKAGQDFLNEYRKQKVEELIVVKLLQQEAENQNITLSDEKKNELFNEQLAYIKQQNGFSSDEQFENALKQNGFESLAAFKDYFFEQNTKVLEVNELRERLLGEITVSDKEIEDYYNENIESYKFGDQVKASHILLETEESAKEVLEKLNNGADFAEMAKEYSTGPSAEDGGDLGFFEKGDMVKEFEEAAFGLEVGETSDIVKTQYGYHIILVTDKREAGVKSLEEVKDNIKSGLLANKRKETWENFVEELREKAEIEIKL
jgi:peptidyl-prolyl cis-trans isomerase C/foldase protein PrsA